MTIEMRNLGDELEGNDVCRELDSALEDLAKGATSNHLQHLVALHAVRGNGSKSNGHRHQRLLSRQSSLHP